MATRKIYGTLASPSGESIFLTPTNGGEISGTITAYGAPIASGTISSVNFSFNNSPITIYTADTFIEVKLDSDDIAGTMIFDSTGSYTNAELLGPNPDLLFLTPTNVTLRATSGQAAVLSSYTFTITITYNESTTTTPTLSTPGDPVITYTPGASTFRVSWSPAYGSNGTGIVTYDLFMQGRGYVVSNESVTSYTGPVPEAGTYNFRVTAYYGSLSQQSKAVSYTFEKATVTTPTLTAPTDLKLSASSGEEVTLTWTEAQLNNSEINYAITYKIGYLITGQDVVQWPSGLSTYNNNFLINKQWFLDNNISNGTEIQFWLQASVAAYDLFKYVGFPVFKVILSENEKNQNSVGYYIDGAWQECTVYYYDGSEWVECIPYYYDNGWQEINTKIE